MKKDPPRGGSVTMPCFSSSDQVPNNGLLLFLVPKEADFTIVLCCITRAPPPCLLACFLSTSSRDSAFLILNSLLWCRVAATSPRGPQCPLCFFFFPLELELELIQTHMAQKPMLRVGVGARFVAQSGWKRGGGSYPGHPIYLCISRSGLCSSSAGKAR